MDLVNLLKESITLEVLYYTFTFFVVFDILTGMVKAWKNGRFKSRTLRDGLFASLGEVILLALAIVIGILIPVAKPIIFMLFVFMCLKELASIVENLVQIGVHVPEWLIKGLNVYREKLNTLDKME
ncbi:phage holin family protein [Clostridium culturomicium]|uniref:phage holin family protein n=1 Tax=Clostridium culturomicium TaxID=1499683 RepID=UPI0038574931